MSQYTDASSDDTKQGLNFQAENQACPTCSACKSRFSSFISLASVLRPPRKNGNLIGHTFVQPRSPPLPRHSQLAIRNYAAEPPNANLIPNHMKMGTIAFSTSVVCFNHSFNGFNTANLCNSTKYSWSRPSAHHGQTVVSSFEVSRSLLCSIRRCMHARALIDFSDGRTRHFRTVPAPEIVTEHFEACLPSLSF